MNVDVKLADEDEGSPTSDELAEVIIFPNFATAATAAVCTAIAVVNNSMASKLLLLLLSPYLIIMSTQD